MYRYRILLSLETPLDKKIIADEALRTAARVLGIQVPSLFFIEEDRLGTIEYDTRIAALAEPTTKSIYIVVDQSLQDIAATTIHEAWHIYDSQGGDRELRADAFLGRVWGSYTTKTRLVEIMKGLAEIAAGGSRQAVPTKIEQRGKPTSFANRTRYATAAEQRKLKEIRDNYYRYATSLAETWVKPTYYH